VALEECALAPWWRVGLSKEKEQLFFMAFYLRKGMRNWERSVCTSHASTHGVAGLEILSLSRSEVGEETVVAK